MKNKTPILLIEDDPVDQMLFRRALNGIKIRNRLLVADNGEEALELLKSAGNERPCLILLDLNMPKMNGIEFLRALKDDRSLKTIPAVVLTTSKEDKDIREAFGLGIAGYMVKPVDYSKFIEVVRTIYSYWVLSEMPSR